MAKKLTKKQLIDILVNDYGYEKDDIKMLTNAKLEGIIKQEQEDAKELEEMETIVVAKAPKIKDEDQIMVMNGLNGSLTHRSLVTGRIWKFRAFGQTEKIPFSELLSIRNLSPKVFEDGWMIILNKTVQEEFGLKEKYKNILTPDNIDSIFDKDINDLKEFIENLPEGMKVTFVGRARQLHQEGKIDSVAKLKFIQEYFNVSFDDNAPLSDLV